MDVIDVLVCICWCSVGCEGPEEQQEFDHHCPDGGGKGTTPICWSPSQRTSITQIIIQECTHILLKCGKFWVNNLQWCLLWGNYWVDSFREPPCEQGEDQPWSDLEQHQAHRINIPLVNRWMCVWSSYSLRFILIKSQRIWPLTSG